MARNKVVYYTMLACVFLLAVVFRNYYTEMAVKCILIVTVVFGVISFISVRMVDVKFDNKRYEAILGSALDVKICATNYSFFPISRLDIVYDVVYNKTGLETHTERVNLMPRRKTTINIQHKTTKIGASIIKIREIYVYDFFEYGRKKRKRVDWAECFVYPEDMSAKLNIRPRLIEDDDEHSIYSTVKPGNDKSELFAIREYVEGDNIKNIHWKLSARREEVLIKEFSLPLESDLYIVPQIYEGDIGECESIQNNITPILTRIENRHYRLVYSLSKALAENKVIHYIYVNGQKYLVEDEESVITAFREVLKATIYNQGLGEDAPAENINGSVIYMCKTINTGYFERISEMAAAGVNYVILTGDKRDERIPGMEEYVKEHESKFIFSDIAVKIEDMEMVEF